MALGLKVVFLYSYLFFFSGLVGFVISRSHLIMVLVSLEFMVLSLYMIIVVWFSFFDFGLMYSVIYLVMGVCVGALGLAVMVGLVRTHGSDMYLVGSLLNC